MYDRNDDATSAGRKVVIGALWSRVDASVASSPVVVSPWPPVRARKHLDVHCQRASAEDYCAAPSVSRLSTQKRALPSDPLN
jgi:hypothetical protein